jgi:hypothetical protein
MKASWYKSSHKSHKHASTQPLPPTLTHTQTDALQGGDLRNNIRISAGRPEDTDKLFKALEDFEAENYNAKAAEELAKLKDIECVIFDMDGVLVDVSQSYRAAIGTYTRLGSCECCVDVQMCVRVDVFA